MGENKDLEPVELQKVREVTGEIVREYLAAVRFIIGDSARDPSFGSTHLLSYLSQDLIESAISIIFPSASGSLSVPQA